MNRNQIIEINKKKFKLHAIKYGVSKRLVLGSLLFLIYISDLISSVTHSKDLSFCSWHKYVIY